MGIIYKPSTRKGPVFLSSSNLGAPTIIGPNGQRFTAVPANQRGGAFFNEGNYQWVFPNDVIGLKGAQISFGGQTGVLQDGAKDWRGSSFSDWKTTGKGSIGDTSSTGGGSVPGGFEPGQIGVGSFPAYLGGLFPNPTFSNFPSIQQAPYKYTDPQKFATKFNDFNRGEIQKNADLASKLTFDQLDTELKGLKTYAPAASALKRQIINEDNTFNTAERGRSVDAALPGVRGDLESQAGRARTLASGQLPSSIDDRAFEVANRSASADNSSAAGFGGSSFAARKASDLLSADARLKLSQYGDQLLNTNINNKATLFLPQTEYSDAGAQIRSTPSLSPTQLFQSNFGAANQLASLPTSQAIGVETQQQQFITGIDQQTRQFNASGEFAESQFNASAANTFALDKFQYQVGFAGAVAGAQQTDTNAQIAQQQQNQATAAGQNAAGQVAAGQNIAGAGQVFGTIAGAVGGAIAGSGGGGTTSSGPVTIGGTSYPSASSEGGGEGSIIVPSGGSIPTGYEDTGTRASGGGIIARPSRKGGSSSGGGSSSSGTSDAPFDTGNPSSNDGDTFKQPDEEPRGTTPDDGSFGNPDDSSQPSPPPQGEDTTSDNPETQSANEPVDGNMGAFNSSTDVPLPDKSVQGDMIRHSDASLSNSGVYTKSAPGTQPIGVDNSGKELHGNVSMMKSQNGSAGTQAVDGFVSQLAPLGVFTGKDRETINQIAQVAGNAQLMAQLQEFRRKGDTAGFVNALAQALKQPTINAVTKDPKNRAGLNGLYTGYNLFQNWDRMSTAQRGLAIASLGLQGYQFATGENLAKKPIIAASPGKPGLTVGQALGLFQQGYNIYAVAKNWDQLTTLQKIQAGVQSAAGLAKTGKQLGLIGNGTTGGALPYTAQQLTSQGFSPAPANGVGAITAPAGTQIPDGYTQLPPNADGSVNAIPTANADTASGIRAGQVVGGAMAVTGAISVYNNWGKGGEQGAYVGYEGGSQMAAGLAQMGQTNPYVLGAVVAGSTLGGVIQNKPVARTVEVGTYATAGYAAYTANAEAAGTQSPYAGPIARGAAIAGAVYQGEQIRKSDLSDKEKARASRRVAEDTAGAIASFGISAAAQAADRLVFKGVGSKYHDKLDRANPVAKQVDRIGAPIWKGIDKLSGGKNKEQVARDNVRGITGTDVVLADGSTASIGVDGHGEERDVTNKDLLTDEHKKAGITKLHAYDTDYTNDLDYAAGMGGTALSRLLVGGKAKEVDQVGGEIGNASLKNVGYGKEMSQENFSKMAANQKAIWAQKGINSKEAAYQLINQAYSEKRLDEFDATQARQAVNMIFDKNGYDTAQKLLGGRHRGIQVSQEPGAFENKPSEFPVASGGQPVGRGVGDANQVSRTPQQGANGATAGPQGPGGGYPVGRTPQGAQPQLPPGRDTANTVNGQQTTGARPPGFDQSEAVPYSNVKSKMMMSKEDAVARNKAKYSGRAA